MEQNVSSSPAGEGEQRMNEGPFRMPNSADRGSSRQAASQPEPVAEEPKQPEEPKPVVHHRTTSSSSRRSIHEEKSKKPLIMAGAAVAAVVVVCLLVWALLPKGAANPPIDSSKYQAVSFNDGQLYFGKLSFVNDQYMKLTDIYYLQPQSDGSGSTDSSVQKATNSQNFKLVKFTDVIYGPEDEMTIPKSQVLFFENIKSDGKVSQLIAQYKKTH